MSDLREAAQQALEALERYDGCLTHFHERVDHSSAITAIRAALAEPVQEPVAWTYEWKHRLHGGSLNVSRARWPESDLWIETPLYAAPPQRKPLTVDEIADAANSVRWSQQYHVEFARAIERAHGID